MKHRNPQRWGERVVRPQDSAGGERGWGKWRNFAAEKTCSAVQTCQIFLYRNPLLLWQQSTLVLPNCPKSFCICQRNPANQLQQWLCQTNPLSCCVLSMFLSFPSWYLLNSRLVPWGDLQHRCPSPSPHTAHLQRSCSSPEPANETCLRLRPNPCKLSNIHGVWQALPRKEQQVQEARAEPRRQHPQHERLCKLRSLAVTLQVSVGMEVPGAHAKVGVGPTRAFALWFGPSAHHVVLPHLSPPFLGDSRTRFTAAVNQHNSSTTCRAAVLCATDLSPIRAQRASYFVKYQALHSRGESD